MDSPFHDHFTKVVLIIAAIAGAIYGYFQVEYGDSVLMTMFTWSWLSSTASLFVIVLPFFIFIDCLGYEIRASAKEEKIIINPTFVPYDAEYITAAEQGHADAQNNLGEMYSKGQGVPQDYAEAVRWYRLAAEQGYAPAQNNLGAAYQLGDGVLQDNVMAHMWYNIASANGDPKSGERRDERAGLMSQTDISTAQEMARECMSSNYQNCGG